MLGSTSVEVQRLGVSGPSSSNNGEFFQEVNIKEVVVFLRYFLGFLGEERERDKNTSTSLGLSHRSRASSRSRSSKSPF